MTCVAVIDVETTGLNPYRHDRVVEIAAVLISLDGTVLRQFVTLVNPERDIGPTRVHGINSRDIISAPRFCEIAGALVEVLDGCVALSGHNVRFDLSFLAAEFERLGCCFPDGPTLCTMRLSGGGSLRTACSHFGIEAEGEFHTAWYDALATARLLAEVLKNDPFLANEVSHMAPITWPNIPRGSARLQTRCQSRERITEPPAYLQRLLTRMQPHTLSDNDGEAVRAYTAFLDQVFEDRQVDEEEEDALVELATRWGLSGEQIQKANWDYLMRLGAAAHADGIVTDAERRDLCHVASLLGYGSRDLAEILRMAAQELRHIERQSCPAVETLAAGEFAGKRVCFTGECQCRLKGETITRELATELATNHGMIVAESVTKKLGVLVVADPFTQSGKAKKARQYGIRIVHEHVFWTALGLKVE